jgi:hypothetical protein
VTLVETTASSLLVWSRSAVPLVICAQIPAPAAETARRAASNGIEVTHCSLVAISWLACKVADIGGVLLRGAHCKTVPIPLLLQLVAVGNELLLGTLAFHACENLGLRIYRFTSMIRYPSSVGLKVLFIRIITSWSSPRLFAFAMLSVMILVPCAFWKRWCWALSSASFSYRPWYTYWWQENPSY